MQILYMAENGKILGTTDIIDVLRDTAKNFICPPVLSVRSLIINKEEVFSFFQFLVYFSHSYLYDCYCFVCRRKKVLKHFSVTVFDLLHFSSSYVVIIELVKEINFLIYSKTMQPFKMRYTELCSIN